MRQPHVAREVLGEARLRARLRPSGEVVALDHAGRHRRRCGRRRRRRRRRAESALAPVDLAPGGERADVVLHGLDDVAQQDVVPDRLLLELLEQLLALGRELVAGRGRRSRPAAGRRWRPRAESICVSRPALDCAPSLVPLLRGAGAARSPNHSPAWSGRLASGERATMARRRRTIRSGRRRPATGLRSAAQGP